MPPDVIIYAIVAAGLVFWLRSILGTRHGEERERPNPYSVTENPVEKPVSGAALAADARPASAKPLQAPSVVAFAPGGLYAIENKTAENALIEIAEADAEFDAILFMNGAQEAFTMIVEAFAAGNRETLKDLLGSSVYKAFETAIKDRESKGETLETRIQSLQKAEITAARLDGGMAFITVRFTADEISIHKDSEGRILSGAPDEPQKMVDVWTFSHPVHSDDPKWLLVETHSEGDDDNDIIPNSK